MRYALLASFFLLPIAAPGQDRPAERIAPYLTDDALAVARIDLARLDAEAAVERLQPFLAAAGDPAEFRRRAAELAKRARDSGVTEVYAVVTPRGGPADAVYVVAPHLERDGERRSVLDPLGLGTTSNLEGAEIAGSAEMIERLKLELAGADDTERPGLTEAFAAVADHPVQVVIVPTADQRRVLRELLPDLPPDLGGATGERLAAGLRWAALGLSVDPKLSTKLVVQSDSEEAAEALRAALAAGLTRLAADAELARAFPVLPALAGSLSPQRDGSRLVLAADESLEQAGRLLAEVAAAARKEGAKEAAAQALKRLGLAMHNFHDQWGSFPPSAGYAADTPLLSWRVYLLPYLGEQELYEQFLLDEPWDSEHNRKLIEKMPAVYTAPGVDLPPGHTVFLAPVGEGFAFDGMAGTMFQDITDGTSNTVLLVEAPAEKAVPWTRPEDLPIDREKPLAGLARGRDSFGVLLGDGSVHRISTKIDPQVFLHLLTRAGGEVVDWDKVHP
ncbi:MAG TPA: DUF1559 domain-containing protein [Planctomycetaceae bacterium]